ncbi:MAG: GWxTD domain-containing protein [Bacteroidetes bacterium]|nr:GWxTD domain-containing protein [Bacteroidota bacterium]
MVSSFQVVWAQPEIFAEVLHFKTQEGKPYQEVQFRIPANTVKFNTLENGFYQAKLRVNLLQVKGTDTLTNYLYELLSPPQQIPGGSHNIIDAKKLPLHPGLFKTIIKVKDQHNGLTAEFEKATNSNGQVQAFSNIILVESYEALAKPNDFTHCNLNMIPRLLPLYRADEDFVTFFAEYYGNAKKVNLNLVSEDSVRVLKTAIPTFQYGKVKGILYTISASELSGNYEINLSANHENDFHFTNKIIRVYNQQNPTLFTKKIPYATLKIYTQYLAPIAQGVAWNRLDSVLKTDDSTALKIEFYRFWSAIKPTDPHSAWNNYLELVKLANKNFSSAGREGYLSDRGRVYLKYGKPVEINEFHDDPYTYPYEIWQYYNVGIQGSAQFIFANTSFTSNRFDLLHSTAQGEISNPNWKQQIERGSGDQKHGRWGSDWEE